MTSIAIAAALDDTALGTVASRGPGEVIVRSAAGILAAHTITGLTVERCVVLAEIYRRDSGWKIRAVSQGWANGIADLIESYGIVVDAPAPDPEASKPALIVVPDEFGAEPIGAGEEAWRKKRSGQPLNEFEDLHALEYEQGLVRGAHFLKWSGEVARLKREGHLHEALAVLLEILDATERVQAQERTNAPVRAALFRGRVMEALGLLKTQTGFGPNAGAMIVSRPTGGTAMLMRMQVAAQGFRRRTWCRLGSCSGPR